MMLWLKKNHQSLIDPKIKVPSFIGSLFNWRPDAVTIPDESKYQKYIDSIKVSDLNQEMINHITTTIMKFLLLDLMSEYLNNNTPEISERSYLLRVLDYLRTGRPFIEAYTFFHCVLFIIHVIISFKLIWNTNCIVYGMILKFLLSNDIDKNRDKNRKQRQESKSLKTIIKEWLILSIFYTKPIMGNPYFSTSPRDLWSNQWHQIYNHVFQELGYLPVKNYFGCNKTLGRALGICSAFLISGLFHDYLAIVSFSHFSIDFTIFFLFNGILLVLWEAVEGDILGRGNEFKDSFGIKVFKMSLFLPIVIFMVPLFAEPYIKGLYIYSHLNIYTNLTKLFNWRTM
ncbi:6628_t:CDS:1 [Cetraspora pellucida]|uniref:6628_t:CDS:1 n=1 Tax=Cetraspora pellucida TaxID=1433469 RepID=A0A9N9HCU5_9GLOM|nr:6628_t:CDS:1 [Cetraspora pellucida]